MESINDNISQLLKNFDFITKFFSRKLSKCNLEFSDVHLQKEYKKQIFEEKRKSFLFMGFIFLILVISVLIVMFVTYDKSLNLWYYIIQYLCYIVFYVFLIIFGFCVKSHNNCFTLCQIILVSLFFSTQFINICLGMFNGNKGINLTRNLFFLFSTTYFTCNFFFGFSIKKAVILNSIMIGVIGLFYGSKFESNSTPEVIYLFAIMCYFEVSGYINERFSKLYFLEKQQNLLITNYFLEILKQMNIGLGILRDGKIIFGNHKFNECFREDIENEGNFDLYKVLNLIPNTPNFHHSEDKFYLQSRRNQAETLNILTTRTEVTNQIKLHEWSSNENIIVNFHKLGLYKKEEKTYEIFLSSHKVLDNDIVELIVSDITDSLEKQQIKQEFKIKSAVVAKISHEFTTPLIVIREAVKQNNNICKDKFLNRNEQEECSDYTTISKNFNKIRYLSKYLDILIKELSYYIKDYEIPLMSNIFSEVDLMCLIKKCQKLIQHIKEPNTENKEKLINFRLDIEIENDNTKMVTSSECQIFVYTQYDKLYHFLINIFILISKILSKSEIIVKIIVPRDYINPLLLDSLSNEADLESFNSKVQIKIDIICNSNVSINDITHGIYLMQEDDYYKKYQGMHMNYFFCKELDLELKANLDLRSCEGKLILSFQQELKKIVINTSSNTIINKNLFPTQILNKMQNESVDTIKMDFLPNPAFKSRFSFSPNNNNNNNISLLQPENSESFINIYNTGQMYPNSTNIAISNNIKIMQIVRKDSPKSRGMIEKKRSQFKNLTNKKIILIADDFKDIRKSVKKLVTSIIQESNAKIHKTEKQYEVVDCSDGAELLYFIYNSLFVEDNNNQIVCIITDEMMNFINGSEAIKIIKKVIAEKNLDPIPIFFSTAFLDLDNISTINALNPTKILNKPLQKVKLIEAFRECKIINI
jgi:CheY-like chemotaxis protein